MGPTDPPVGPRTTHLCKHKWESLWMSHPPRRMTRTLARGSLTSFASTDYLRGLGARERVRGLIVHRRCEREIRKRAASPLTGLSERTRKNYSGEVRSYRMACQIELECSLGDKIFLRLEMKKKTLNPPRRNSAGGNRRSGKRYRVREEIPVYTQQLVKSHCEVWLKKRGLDILNNG